MIHNENENELAMVVIVNHASRYLIFGNDLDGVWEATSRY